MDIVSHFIDEETETQRGWVIFLRFIQVAGVRAGIWAPVSWPCTCCVVDPVLVAGTGKVT